jgi:hypothetical protein
MAFVSNKEFADHRRQSSDLSSGIQFLMIAAIFYDEGIRLGAERQVSMTKEILAVKTVLTNSATLAGVRGMSTCGQQEKVTVERIERAIKMTAEAIVRHNLPEIVPTLKRLETERDRLLQEGDPIAYAKRLLARNAA